MQTRRILLGALSAPLLLLPACGGGDSVADPPVSSAPPSSDPTQPPKRESPEHFIRRWVASEKEMENTGRTAAYLAISRDCVPCRKLAHEVETFYAHGGFVKWGGWTILSISKSESDGPGVTFAVKIDSAPTTYKESNSASTQRLSGGRSVELLTVRRRSGKWQMIKTVEQAS